MKLNIFSRSRREDPRPPPRFNQAKFLTARPDTPATARLPANPPSKQVTTNLFSTTLAEQEFFWLGSNRADFYRYIRDHVPIISAAVWTWVHLCATNQTYLIDGPEEKKEPAKKIIEIMDARILDCPPTRQPAIEHLVRQLLTEIFTVGKFACQYTKTKDEKGIGTILPLNTDAIKWEIKEGLWTAYTEVESPNTATQKKVYIDVENFFYATLASDVNDPAGMEPLASVPFVAQIQEALAYDMAKSSHSAGQPRLHIAITPPPPFAHESEKEYQERINKYFDDTVSEFGTLNPEDMLFTWSDITVKIVGGDTGRNFAWRLNREQIVEDVITGLHLYPWVLGRSHGTTKNWVEAQFNVLMQVVETVQGLAKGFADWIRNTELALAGNPCKTSHIFAPNQDPFITQKMNATRMEYDTIDLMVKRGYISKDEGARRLGLPKAFKQDTERQQPPEKEPKP